MPFKPIRTLRHLQNRICPFHYQYTAAADFRFLLRKINLYYRLNPQKKKSFAQEIDFLNQPSKTNDSVSIVWPYPYTQSYQAANIDVQLDETKGLFYVLQNGRRLYYSRKYTSAKAVQESYNSLMVEQHPLSPHLYQREGFKVEKDDFVVDIGCAEGNFSLDVVETAGQILLVESEAHWIEALQATFEPWKEKVRIVHNYISDTDDAHSATLRKLVGNQTIDFLKLDVEGAERSILESSSELLRQKQIRKLAVCTYHKKNDAKTFDTLLTNLGYTVQFTPGFMLFVYGKLTPPYFRKVLLQAEASGK